MCLVCERRTAELETVGEVRIETKSGDSNCAHQRVF